jgi:predicted DCC family thiol-disulfide oxidoreductase YuxK
MFSRWIRQRLELAVLYDGWCPLCTRSARWWSRIDLLALVRFVSFRDPGVAALYGLDVERAARRIQAVASDGSVREGMDALIAIAGRSVILWPALPLLVLGRLVAGQRLYDALARRRTILIPGACEEHCQVRQPSRPAGG